MKPYRVPKWEMVIAMIVYNRSRGDVKIRHQNMEELGIRSIAWRALNVDEWQDEERLITEVERVYSTRYDCMTAPGGARRIAA